MSVACFSNQTFAIAVCRFTPAHLLLREVDFASVAGAHAQFGHPQVGPQTRLEPRGPVVDVLHENRDGGHGREEGLVGGGAVEGVLEGERFTGQRQRRSSFLNAVSM